MIHLRKKKKEEHTPKVKKKTGIIQSILNPIGFAKKLYDDDQVMTNAATITLFMVMSLFPMLMILLWLMSRMMLSPEVLLKIVSSVLPEEMLELVTGTVSDLYEKSLSVSALSITIIMALWSSSTGISFLVKGLNRVYKREEQRNWFVHRALCLVYTGIFLVIMLLVMAFLVYGSKFRVFLVFSFLPFTTFSRKSVCLIESRCLVQSQQLLDGTAFQRSTPHIYATVRILPLCMEALR